MMQVQNFLCNFIWCGAVTWFHTCFISDTDKAWTDMTIIVSRCNLLHLTSWPPTVHKSRLSGFQNQRDMIQPNTISRQKANENVHSKDQKIVLLPLMMSARLFGPCHRYLVLVVVHLLLALGSYWFSIETVSSNICSAAVNQSRSRLLKCWSLMSPHRDLAAGIPF